MATPSPNRCSGGVPPWISVPGRQKISKNNPRSGGAPAGPTGCRGARGKEFDGVAAKVSREVKATGAKEWG
ncbi:MAG: hypothetical protein LBS68_00955 [Puniceicoccales bacterium]|nr:hypothetical protein [Puniceicoccales bacterium]